MGRTGLTEYLRYVYGPLEGRTAYTAYYSTIVVELTNHDFLSPGWKIAIGSLSTSALAASRSDLQLARSTVWKVAQKAPRGVGDFLCTSFASYGSISYVFLLCFMVLLK